jgi:pyridoxamine 5'-phosphate oxidase
MTPDDIAAAVWRELGRAVHDKGHAWRTPVLATVDETLAADARTVVLREVDAASKSLRFYTDAQSPKARQIAAHPIGTLVMWSASLRWQLRCRVRLTIAEDAARWEAIKDSPAARDYPSGRFAVVTAAVEQIDWLELSTEGHRHATL